MSHPTPPSATVTTKSQSDSSTKPIDEQMKECHAEQIRSAEENYQVKKHPTTRIPQVVDMKATAARTDKKDVTLEEGDCSISRKEMARIEKLNALPSATIRLLKSHTKSPFATVVNKVSCGCFCK